MNAFLFTIFLIHFVHSKSSKKDSTNTEDACKFRENHAQCTLNIMEEHIVASATVNHCHEPVDVTFKVKFHYGNSNDTLWQYTFVTSNQNERILIPGLILPPAPHAYVYLFIRIPKPRVEGADKRVIIEASFVAILADSTWEEVEFLKDTITLKSESCVGQFQQYYHVLFLSVGIIFLVVLMILLSSVAFIYYRRRRKTLEELTLVADAGVTGAIPYQIGSNSSANPTSKNNSTTSNDTPLTESIIKNPGFKFGRLQEENIENEKNYQENGKNYEENDKNLSNGKITHENVTIIGNPNFIEKTKNLTSKNCAKNSTLNGTSEKIATTKFLNSPVDPNRSRDHRLQNKMGFENRAFRDT